MCSRSVVNFFNELLFNFIVGTIGIIIFEEEFSIFLEKVFKLALIFVARELKLQPIKSKFKNQTYFLSMKIDLLLKVSSIFEFLHLYHLGVVFFFDFYVSQYSWQGSSDWNIQRTPSIIVWVKNKWNPSNDPWFSVTTFEAFHSAIQSTSPPVVAVSIFGGTIFFRFRWSFSQWREEQMMDKLFPVPVGDSKIPIFRDSIVSYNFRMNLTYTKNKSFSQKFDIPFEPGDDKAASKLPSGEYWSKILPGYHRGRMEI